MPESTREARFKKLLGKLLDEDLSGEEFAEFTGLVKSDPEFSQELRLQLLMDSRLVHYENERSQADVFTAAVGAALDAEKDGSRFVSKVVRLSEEETSSSPASPIPWAVAIASLAACAFFAFVWLSSQENEANEELTPGVAMIERLVGELSHDDIAKTAGDAVGPGILELESGYLALEFYKGARMNVAGPAKLELVDAQRVVCHFGKIRTTVPAVASGFTVATTETEIVDLGTEFAMEVGAGGVTEVHVFDGEVEAYDAIRSPRSKKLLTAGRAMKMEDSDAWKSMPAQSSRFAELDTINQLSDNEDSLKLVAWKSVRESAKNDSRLIAYYDFEPEAGTNKRTLINRAATGRALDGAIVGAQWKEGPWPGKRSLNFKHPGDRVRINIPGEYDNITLAAWVRVDGLDRSHSSLILTDGFDPGEIHWQFRKDGKLSLGINHRNPKKGGYGQTGFMDLNRLGRWFHLVSVIDQSKASVTHYVDGDLLGSTKLLGTGPFVFGDSSIGNWDPAAIRSKRSIRSLNGAIAELMIFQEALEAPEIRRLALKK